MRISSPISSLSSEERWDTTAIAYIVSKFVTITEAAEALGVTATTLRRWEVSGKLEPVRTEGGARRYDMSVIKPELFITEPKGRKAIAHARVSSHDQKNDLERKKQVLETYCAAQGWKFDVIADLGSGLNYNKKGLNRLLS